MHVLLSDCIGGDYSRSTVESQPTGGGELHLVQLAEALARLGHTVTVANGVPAPREEFGVLYTPNELAPARVDVVVVQRYSPDPATLRERTIVHVIDPFNAAYDRHRALFAAPGTRTVAVSKWAAATFAPLGARVSVIPPMLEPMPSAEKDSNLYIYPCAALKGLAATLAVWRDMKQKYTYEFADAKLRIVSPGYGEPDMAQIRSTPDCTYDGPLRPSAWRKAVAEAAALFCVNTHAETYCCTLAFAEMARTRGHMLCRAGFGGMPEAVANSRLLTASQGDFERDVVAAWEEPAREEWYAAGLLQDRSPDAIVRDWVHVMEAP